MVDLIKNEGVDTYKPVNIRRSALDYMDHYNPEKAINNVSKKDWSNFVGGMATIYSIVFNQENPDVILAPYRGVSYLIWALEEMAEKTGKEMPTVVRLPIGTHTDMYDFDHENGIKGGEKRKVLDLYFKELEPEKEEIKKILLLDEARTGGTISQAASHIDDIRIDYEKKGWKFEVVVCMAQDSEKNGGTVDKAVKYLIANKMGKSHKIGMPLPFIDVRHVLPTILAQDPQYRKNEGIYEEWELLEIVENEKSKKLFQDKLGKTLDEINWPGSYTKPK